MPLIDIDSLNKDITANPYLQMSPEERQAERARLNGLLAQKRKESLMGAINTGVQGIGDIFLQKGGITPPTPPKTEISDLNEFIMKEMIKRKLEGDPMEKFRQEQQVRADMEAQDPYKQSQLEINKAILKSIEGGQGGDLVYREQLTGVEVPPEQALQRIGQGEQFIIKRRITSRQGIKEEEVSTPKELTEGEAKTSSGAEEVLKEIDDLEKIILSEPTDKGDSIPFFGKSAQAQGVKIPFIAPYGVSEKGQEYRTIRESINNRLLYLRSGAQINDKEYRRLSGMLPELFRSDKVDLQQLERFKNEFAIILKRIQLGRRGMPLSTTQKGPPNDIAVNQNKIGRFIVEEE